MNPTASRAPAVSDDAALRLLSGLMDGDADPDDAQRGAALWRDDASCRERWHTWHLIGDAMRSDDLAAAPARDEAFLARLRERLADEPALLAPTPVAPAAAPALRRRQAWLTPAAIAAGFVAVAGVLVVTRSGAPDAGVGGTLAGAPAPVVGAGVQRVGVLPTPGGALVLDGQMVRDAQLDAYLRAHRQMIGGAPAALPGGAMRSVETIVPTR